MRRMRHRSRDQQTRIKTPRGGVYFSDLFKERLNFVTFTLIIRNKTLLIFFSHHGVYDSFFIAAIILRDWNNMCAPHVEISCDNNLFYFYLKLLAHSFLPFSLVGEKKEKRWSVQTRLKRIDLMAIFEPQIECSSDEPINLHGPERSISCTLQIPLSFLTRNFNYVCEVLLVCLFV